MSTVWFVDTSVFCNLLPVPGFDQHAAEVKTHAAVLHQSHSVLILPLTAVIETGNHISHLPSGAVRRRAATRFQEVLTMVRDGHAPWQLHTFSWDDQFLGRLIGGAGTSRSLVDHAMAGLGCGDLCVLAEREIYQERTGLNDVRIWTLDAELEAYS